LHAACTGDPADDLLDSLRATLPAHLVPRTIAHWNELPLNPNGKIDRRAIAAHFRN
jgi:acyl-coenzyme A synthetase/AMP-(fatty) acid ligase